MKTLLPFVAAATLALTAGAAPAQSKNGGKTGWKNDRRPWLASIRKPRQDWSSRNTATEDHV